MNENIIHANDIFAKHIVMQKKRELSEYVRGVMKEKRLSFREVARNSGGRISYTAVNNIVNEKHANILSETLSALAVGLGVPEDEVFRVARGLSSDAPSDIEEILAERFDGQALTHADWIDIENTLRLIIEQRKALRSALGKFEKPLTPSKFQRKK